MKTNHPIPAKVSQDGMNQSVTNGKLIKPISPYLKFSPMKKLTILFAFIVLAFSTASAQKKKSDPRAITSFNGSISPGFKNNYSTATFLIPPDSFKHNVMPIASLVFLNPETGKEIMSLNLKKDGKNIGLQAGWDLMELHMDKKSFRWLNDSTAVYIKPIGK